MKLLLTLLGLLLSSATNAQTQPQPQQKQPVAAKAKPDTVQRGKEMTELDYYRKLAEQAQQQADRAHDDLKWYYEFSAGSALTIFTVLLAFQFFNVRSQLKRIKNKVDGIMQEVNREVDRRYKGDKRIIKQEIKEAEKRLSDFVSLHANRVDSPIISSLGYMLTPQEMSAEHAATSAIKVIIEQILSLPNDAASQTIELPIKNLIKTLGEQELNNSLYVLLLSVISKLREFHIPTVMLQVELQQAIGTVKRYVMRGNNPVTGRGVSNIKYYIPTGNIAID